MAKRPQISNEELYDHVMRLHREYTGSSAGNFETALETVVQLAEDQVLNREDPDPEWYPGKYLGQFVDAISGNDAHRDLGGQQSRTENSSMVPPQMDPQDHPVFKTMLGEDYEIAVPEAEVAAFDLEPGELMQVFMYSIETDR